MREQTNLLNVLHVWAISIKGQGYADPGCDAQIWPSLRQKQWRRPLKKLERFIRTSLAGGSMKLQFSYVVPNPYINENKGFAQILRGVWYLVGGGGGVEPTYSLPWRRHWIELWWLNLTLSEVNCISNYTFVG